MGFHTNDITAQGANHSSVWKYSAPVLIVTINGFPYAHIPPEKQPIWLTRQRACRYILFIYLFIYLYLQVSVCMCISAHGVYVGEVACSCRDETRLSAALSDCTHERSQNNNKGPSVGRMKALSPAISAQRVSSPTVSLSDTSHITWRQEGETVSRIWPQQIFPYVNETVVGF